MILYESVFLLTLTLQHIPILTSILNLPSFSVASKNLNMGNKICVFVFSCHKSPKPLPSLSPINAPKSNGHVAYFQTRSHHSQIGNNDDDDSDHDLSDSFSCEICAEKRTLYDSFNIKGCQHFYCTECTVKYVASKLDDNITRILCPVSGCKGELDPEYCRVILPEDVFDRWGVALRDCLIASSEKFYCPYKDCSALLINDSNARVEKVVCPVCRREICVECGVPWHSELDCGRFQKLKKKGVDSMAKDLALRKNWRKCPNCKFFVEKTFGCYYVKCRCGVAFCYNCGTRSSANSHTCKKCKG